LGPPASEPSQDSPATAAHAPEPTPARPGHDALAERLIATYGADGAMSVAPGHELPSSEEVARALSLLRALLYPASPPAPRAAGPTPLSHVEAQLAQLRVSLSQQVYRGLPHRCAGVGAACPPCEGRAAEVTDRFLGGLPELRLRLLRDVRAAYEGDPAAT